MADGNGDGACFYLYGERWVHVYGVEGRLAANDGGSAVTDEDG